jgi:thioredoxin-like negative regulator of GroEL
MVPLQPQFPVFNQQIQPVAPVANANPFPPAGLIGGQNQDRLKNEILHRAHVLKASTPDGRTRADRLIASGDQSFWDQKYGVAASKYRDAIAKAPDYPEAHFRLAHAKFAIGHFDSAFTEFLLALELAGSGDRPYFSLEQLYLGDKLAKQQHFDRLNDAMLREPSDGSLVFLYALCLHYDGRPLEARELFVKSSTLAGTHRDYIHHFLPVAPIAEPPL